MTPKKIIYKLDQLQEFDYPSTACSLFLLPNGRMHGTSKLFDHSKTLESILGRKLKSDYEFCNIMANLSIVRIVVNDYKHLFVSVNAIATDSQKQTLKDLGTYGNYESVSIDNNMDMTPGAPSTDYIRRIMGLKFRFSF